MKLEQYQPRKTKEMRMGPIIKSGNNLALILNDLDKFLIIRMVYNPNNWYGTFHVRKDEWEDSELTYEQAFDKYWPFGARLEKYIKHISPRQEGCYQTYKNYKSY